MVRFFAHLCGVMFCASASFAQAMQLNGLSSYSSFGNEQFIGALYTGSPVDKANVLLNADASVRMDMRILADRIGQRSFLSMWIEGLTVNSSAEQMRDVVNELGQFNRSFHGALYRGDLLSFDYQRGSLMSIHLNGVLIAEIHSGKFFRLLLKSWIGDVPISSDYKAAMLAGGKYDVTLFEFYSSFTLNSQRVAEIEAWQQPAQDTLEPVVAPAKINATPDAVAVIAPAVVVQKTTQKEAQKVTPKVTPKSTAQPEREITRISSAPVATPKPQQATPQPITTDVALAEQVSESADAPLDEVSLQQRQDYYRLVSDQILKYQTLPRQAFQRRIEGQVRVYVTVNRQGQLKAVQLSAESPHKIFNDQAFDAVNQAAPFPPLPSSITDDEHSFSVPLSYRLPY